MTKPPKSILDPTFRYIPSVQTNVRKTWNRIRREQRQQEQREREAQIEQRQKVRQMIAGRK